MAGIGLAHTLPWSLSPAPPDRSPPPYTVRVQPPPDLTPILRRLDVIEARAEDTRARVYWLQEHR